MYCLEDRESKGMVCTTWKARGRSARQQYRQQASSIYRIYSTVFTVFTVFVELTECTVFTVCTVPDEFGPGPAVAVPVLYITDGSSDG